MNDKQLLIIGDGNFDYYLMPNGSIRSISKDDESHQSYMGGHHRVKQLIDKGYIRGEFTELGKEVLGK